MPTVSDWSALRRPLRSCAIGALVLFALLIAWQFLIPGDDDSSPVVAVAVIFAASLCLASGVGLAVSATRRLWRSTHRGLSVLPALFLVGVVVAFASAAGVVGAEFPGWVGSVLSALLFSSLFSGYLIISAQERAPIPSPPAGINAGDPDAYVSDIPDNRKTG